MTNSWFEETLYANFQLRLRINNVLHHQKTDYQDLIVFENDPFGRVLALDGAIQTTEADEFFYHEMLTHPHHRAYGERHEGGPRKLSRRRDGRLCLEAYRRSEVAAGPGALERPGEAC